jgi:hypothetical protein
MVNVHDAFRVNLFGVAIKPKSSGRHGSAQSDQPHTLHFCSTRRLRHVWIVRQSNIQIDDPVDVQVILMLAAIVYEVLLLVLGGYGGEVSSPLVLHEHALIGRAHVALRSCEEG